MKQIYLSMIRMLWILAFLIPVHVFSVSTNSARHRYDPLLVVVLMVKDEEHVMQGTLQPYVDAGIKSYLILDTGSTDNTIAVTHQFFQEHGITDYYIEERPFVNFAVSRNHALDLAEEHFPNACFMLMVDAEWYMHNVEGLIKYCESEVCKDTSCYFIRLFAKNLDYYLPRMMRCSKHVRYIGVVHETVDLLVDGKAPAEIWFDVYATQRGEEKSRKRWIRDRDMFLDFIRDHPDSPRDMFYLAQTFSCLKDWHNSYLYYQKRSMMNGWEEENYMTWYRMGEVAEVLSLEESHEVWWPRALEHYLKAHSMRPWRSEGLIRIANHYLTVVKNPVIAYVFAKRAFDIPYPDTDILFVEKDFYIYHRYDLVSKTALFVGELMIGEEATRKALGVSPNTPYLYHNLSVYLEAQQALRRKNTVQNVVNVPHGMKQ